MNTEKSLQDNSSLGAQAVCVWPLTHRALHRCQLGTCTHRPPPAEAVPAAAAAAAAFTTLVALAAPSGVAPRWLLPSSNAFSSPWLLPFSCLFVFSLLPFLLFFVVASLDALSLPGSPPPCVSTEPYGAMMLALFEWLLLRLLEPTLPPL